MTRKRTQPSGLSKTPTKSKGSVPNEPWVPVHVLSGPAESLFKDCPTGEHTLFQHETICKPCRDRERERSAETDRVEGSTG